MDQEDYVLKRNGQTEPMSFDKILKRVKGLGENNLKVNYSQLTQKIIDRLYDKIPTSFIDELTAQQCASLTTTNPDYGTLASRILISNHHKNTDENFFNVSEKLYNFHDIHNKHHPIISKKQFDIISKFREEFQEILQYDRDFLIDYFGFKTLERAYLLRINKIVVERPQHMIMRVAIGIHKEDIDSAIITYDLMSKMMFTHATPTLFNAGTPRPQLASCFLVAMKDDSIGGIYDTLKSCAQISKYAGGIGISVSNIRSQGSVIRGSDGISNGLVPMLQVYDKTARYVDQGGGKRKGAIAVYIEVWHPDIFDILEMKKNHGKEEMKGRDLFYVKNRKKRV